MKTFKWYYLLPIIGMFFLWQMLGWVFDGETYQIQASRVYFIIFLAFIHTMLAGLLITFYILP